MNVPVIGLVPLWDLDLNNLWMLPDYIECIKRAGGLPVILPLTSNEALINKMSCMADGFLFTGGPDIHPSLYGEEVDINCGKICKERDDLELSLFTAAVLDMGKPALGICRGIQTFNVASGGTLYQDIPTQFKGSCDICHNHKLSVDVTNHKITIIKDSPLFKLIGDVKIDVNSSHHQGICELAKGFEYMAVSDDGLIEAVYMPDKKFAWAVQWHPELMPGHKSSQLLFDAFVTSCV